MISFATCNITSAKEFMVKASGVDINFDKTPTLIDLIGRDILRVQDPMMHGTAAILPGKAYKPEHKPDADKAVAELMLEIEQGQEQQ